jgi:hypothetical protein
MLLTIKIRMDNAAFSDARGCEVADILHKFAQKCDGAEMPRDAPLFDTNGNKVGFARITGVEDDQP